jgi:tight adherence protein C
MTLLAQLINLEALLPLLIFVAFAALAWCAMEWIAARKPRAVERLENIRTARRRGEPSSAMKKTDAVTKVLQAATPALAKSLEPKSEIEISKLKVRLACAGFRGESASSTFLAIKFVGLLAGLCFGGSVLAGVGGINTQTMMGSVVAGGICFYLPSVVVWLIGKSRQEAIFLGLPDALDLMVVCVEAGLALDQAMRKVADEMKVTYRVIAEEFALANFQLQMGRPKAEVLHELGVRSGVADLRALAAILIQADKFGTSVAQALRVQSDSMRIRRRQIAEEKAAKTAVKLIFPLVLFIFPGIFVVMVGPAAITMIHELMPLLHGTG